MNPMHTTRKNNLQSLVLSKYHGNQAAFSRACGVHANHINLLLTKNEKNRRNMGEDLARRIEKSMGLTPGWLDADHSHATESISIEATDVPPSLRRAISNCVEYKAITVTTAWLGGAAKETTHTLNLARVETKEMSPTLELGDTVVVDFGVKAVTTDGTYLIARDEDGIGFLRNVRKELDGGVVLECANTVFRGSNAESMHGMRVMGKLVSKLPSCRL